LKKITSTDYRSTLKYVLIFLCTFFVMQLLIGTAYIPSSSMDPTLKVGKKYLFFQQSYLFSDPERGDIIVFDDQGTIYCKRIIGLPGDVIDFHDNGVYINGELLDEPYADGVTLPYPKQREVNGELEVYIEDHYEVPEGQYFFMGDNRENSRDSRLWEPQPYIKKSQILGKLIVF